MVEATADPGVSSRISGTAWFALALVCAASIALSLRIWWAQYSPTIPGPPRFDDSVFYYNMAQNIAEGRGYVHPASGLATAQWPPGYSAFLAAIFAFTGPSVTGAEIANALLGAATALLTGLLALILTRDRLAAVISALAVAVMPSLVMTAGVVWSETLFTALFVLGLVLTVHVPRPNGPLRWVWLMALAVVTAAAAYVREAGLVLIPAALVYWLWGAMPRRDALQAVAAVAGVTLLLILPWSVRNYRALDIPVLISSSAAGNFWEGHHEGGQVSNDIVREHGPLNRPGGEADINRAMWREGWAYVRDHPWAELKAPLWKTRDLYRGDPAGMDLNDAYGLIPFTSRETRDRWILLSDVVYYAVLIAAGIGVLAAAWRSPLVRLAVPVVAFWTLGHVTFFVTPRFHLPLLPVFAVCAGYGVAWAGRAAFNHMRSTGVDLHSRPAQTAIVIVAVAAAASSTALLYTQTRSDSAASAIPLHQPVAIDARILCTLSNEDADAALVAGADGGMSVVVGDRTFWLFGDTLYKPEAGKQIGQNSIAASKELRPDGCPRLQYYTDGTAAIPFLPKDGSLTVWPSGAWPVDGDTFDYYTSYVYGSGPYSYTVGEIGVARMDTATMQSTVTARRLWDGASGFRSKIIGAQPVETDGAGRVRVVLQAESGEKYLARVPEGTFHDVQAYEYWDGVAWSTEPQDAATLWTPETDGGDIEELAAFENGAWFAWNEALGKYVAVTNTSFAEVGARTADRLEGPWSGEQVWFDCLTFAQPRVPACYSPMQHPQLARDGGRILLLTLTRMDLYQTIVVEVTLGAPIHEYRRDDAVMYAAEPPGSGWTDEGVAFHASVEQRDRFTPVYRWTSHDRTLESPDSPGIDWTRGEVVFYAPTSPVLPGLIFRYRPIYAWSDGVRQLLSPLETGLEEYGYAREDIMFYAP